jgi:hypothetical protein
MKNMRIRARRLATAAALLAFAACSDAGPGRSGELPTGAEPGLYPSVRVTSTQGAAQVEVSLRQVPGGLRYGSYQGEFVFDPAVLTLKSATLPDEVVGAANEVSPGRVRFMGAALDGTVSEAVLRLEFAATGDVKREALRVTFEEVSTAGEFADVTDQVKNGTLLFQR